MWKADAVGCIFESHESKWTDRDYLMHIVASMGDSISQQSAQIFIQTLSIMKSLPRK